MEIGTDGSDTFMFTMVFYHDEKLVKLYGTSVKKARRLKNSLLQIRQ